MSAGNRGPGRTPYYLYNGLLAAVSPGLALLLVKRLLAGKDRDGWHERWGRVPESLPAKHGPRVWLHAASVGEVMAAQPILERLREREPAAEVIISTITAGGYETAARLVDRLAKQVVYAPFDVPLAVRRTLAAIRPDVLAVMETEIWPNLLHLTSRSGARILLLNARISDRSYPRYLRVRPLFGWALGHVDRIMVQSETDAGRFRALGGRCIEVAGNSKVDQALDRLDPDSVAALRSDLRLAPEAPVLVIGSTRLPDEEAQVLDAYVEALRSVPNLALVHAPRHVERAAEVESAMRARGLQPHRRSASGAQGVRQLILDTYGELARVYAIADVVYIGNSLTPPGGGQNLLQPLAQGKPVLFGPYMQNFRDLVSLAIMSQIGFEVTGSPGITTQVLALLRNPDERARISERAVNLIAANRGAADRYATAISEALSTRR